MSALLPEYEPPHARRAGMAVGAAPLVVLVAFTAIVARWIDPVTGLAWLLGSVLWVVYEMSVFQSTLDAYNRRYCERHLDWRSSDALLALVRTPEVGRPTREFVERFVAAERRVLRDGQTL